MSTLAWKASSRAKTRHIWHEHGLDSSQHMLPQQLQQSFALTTKTIKFEPMLGKIALSHHQKNEIAITTGTGRALLADTANIEMIQDTHTIQLTANGEVVQKHDSGHVLVVMPTATGRMGDTLTSNTNADSMESVGDMA